MKHILFLIPTLDRSGAEKQLTLLACGLPRDEFHVEVVALTRSGPYAEQLEDAGIRLTVIGKRHRFSPRTICHLRQMVDARQPDILHTWLFAANSYGRLAMPHSGRPKVIVSERCVDSWKAGWQLWLDKRLISRTDRMVANSQAVADFYSQLGFPKDRLHVIRNGVELPGTAPTRTRKSICEELQLPTETRLVGFIGRLAAQKRIKDLLWSFELLSSMHKDVFFVIVGDGPQRSELEAFAQSIRVADRVRFLGHRDDAASLLPHLDVFWLASEFEGQSNSLMEAMAAGIPAVVSDIVPNTELVSHEHTGMVVPVGDRAAFTTAASRLLSDHDFARTISETAAAQMETQFSVERMIDEHCRLYRELLQ